MKNPFEVRKTNRVQGQHKLNLEIPKSNQVSFGTKSEICETFRKTYLEEHLRTAVSASCFVL